MSGKRRGIGACAAASALALAAAVALALRFARWRDRVMPRRDPRLPFRELFLTTRDGVRINARMIPGGGGGGEAVIVAHPAVTGQRYAPLVEMAEMLSARFDVFTFDFRGHGGSGGRLELDLAGPLEDLRAVVEEARSRGYAWVGALGFSLGGMASFVHAAACGGLDAVAVVGAPPLLPDVSPYRRILPAWSLFLRLLGARFRAVGDGGPLPMDVAERFPDIPLLVVHAENEAFYSRDDLERMLEKLGGKAEFWVIEGAGHTELAGREQELADWLAVAARKHLGSGPKS